jgi:excisionase family DNA binding protein
MIREKYLNTKEVADMLSIGQDYLRQLLREGKIKGVKVGRRWKIKESDINKIAEGVDNWVKWHKEEEL